jgi:hypothetical protein
LARFLQPDHSKGDVNTIGGYMAVHDRPAAFEGSDGMSYSVAIESGQTGDVQRPWGAYFLFMRWRRMGPQGVEGHLESDFLAYGDDAKAAREALGAMPISGARAELERLIAQHAAENEQRPARKWWDAMRDEE